MVEFCISSNAKVLSRELDWFSQVLETRIALHLSSKCAYTDILEVDCPTLTKDATVYERFVSHYDISVPERLVIALTLAPHLRPSALDMFLLKNATIDQPFTEFGGQIDPLCGFLPTIQTALFLLAGNDMKLRLEYLPMFNEAHFFSSHGVLEFGSTKTAASDIHRVISISMDTRDMLTSGSYRSPKFSSDFPARRIEIPHEWEDLILDPSVMEQVLEIRAWLEHGETILNSLPLGRRLKPGYSALFFGPPGTGKTMTAGLLGKICHTDVYRIDLAMVVSKYIGETEKNLEKVFSQAQHRNWILFFDEADALFGKRTDISDSHDRFANQEVSYLLQRIEDFPGVIILATNKKDNMDDAFLRRIQSFIHFPFPRPPERLNIWENAFTSHIRFHKNVALRQVADTYELSGGSIMNVVRYAALMMVKNKKDNISHADIIEGIRRELKKEGRTP